MTLTPARRRLRFIAAVVLAMAVAVGLSLLALRENVSFFLSPSEVIDKQDMRDPAVDTGRVFRLGGMVKEKSVRRSKDHPSVRFVVTDFAGEITVDYTGILPDLFREGQGVVAKGSLNADGVFTATELLAKHDEKYMPPDVAAAMKAAENRKTQEKP